MLIWGFTAVLNVGKHGDPPPRPVGLPGKIVFLIFACCLVGYLIYKIVSFLFRFVIYLSQACRFWLFKRRLKRTASLVEGQLSTKELLEFYEKFKSDQGKAMVIQLLEKYAEYDEVLINALTHLAYRENDKSLADGLWHLIYEIEKRQLRAA